MINIIVTLLPLFNKFVFSLTANLPNRMYYPFLIVINNSTNDIVEYDLLLFIGNKNSHCLMEVYFVFALLSCQFVFFLKLFFLLVFNIIKYLVEFLFLKKFTYKRSARRIILFQRFIDLAMCKGYQ